MNAGMISRNSRAENGSASAAAMPVNLLKTGASANSDVIPKNVRTTSESLTAALSVMLMHPPRSKMPESIEQELEKAD